MKFSAQGLCKLKLLEGFRATPYKDVGGIWTIGWGRVCSGDPPKCTTEAQEEVHINAKIREIEAAINGAVSAPVTQNQFDALVIFTYNVGIPAFKGSTLLRKLNAKDYAGAANEFKRWNHVGGKVTDGLTNRREVERRLFVGE